MKLISMTDFVLQYEKPAGYFENHSDFLNKQVDFMGEVMVYAKFLKQPLTLGIFVPCDEKGNVLEEAVGADFNSDYDMDNFLEYEKAKERVLFKNASVTPVEDYFIVKIGKREVWVTWTNRTIEDVQHINRAYEVDFELTDSAKSQIYGSPTH